MDTDFQNLKNTHIPSKPPDPLIPSNQPRDQSNFGNPNDPIQFTFKDKLVRNGDQLNFSIDHIASNSTPMEIHKDELTLSSKEDSDKLTLPITITREGKQ